MGNSEIEHVVNIQINRKIIARLKELQIPMDLMGTTIFILIAMLEKKIELLDAADDKNKQRRMLMLYMRLEREKILVQTNKKENNFALELPIYSLTNHGLSLAKWLKNEFNDEIHAENLEPIVEAENSKIQAQDKYGFSLEWCETYNNLFPSFKQSNPKVIYSRLEKFRRMFPEYFKPDLLLCAVQLYIKESAKLDESLTYLRTAQFFLWKMEGKGNITYDIAEWCRKCLTQKQETQHDTNFLNIA